MQLNFHFIYSYTLILVNFSELLVVSHHWSDLPDFNQWGEWIVIWRSALMLDLMHRKRKFVASPAN